MLEKIGGIPGALLILGTLLTLIGAIMTATSQNRDAKNLAAKSDKITKLTEDNAAAYKEYSSKLEAKSDENAKLTQDISKVQIEAAKKQAEDAKRQAHDANILKEKSDQVAAISQELARKSDQIARLAEANANQVTGGNSFCFLRLMPNPTGEYAYIDVAHKGNFPVYDVTATVTDYSRAHQTPDPKKPDTFDGVYYKWEFGNVIPGWLPKSRGPIPLAATGDEVLRILIEARNGAFVEDIIGRRDKDAKWAFDIRVMKLDNVTGKYSVVYEGKDDGQASSSQLPPDFSPSD